MPTLLVKKELTGGVIGLAGVEQLAARSHCSLTAAAIRATECSPYPMAIIVSQGSDICYCFMSEGFKGLGKPLAFLRKGSPLPLSVTRDFNSDPNNVCYGKHRTTETTLADWFDGSGQTRLDEEIVGLGSFGYTLTVFSSDALADDPDDDEADEEANLIASYTPKFAYGRECPQVSGHTQPNCLLPTSIHLPRSWSALGWPSQPPMPLPFQRKGWGRKVDERFRGAKRPSALGTPARGRRPLGGVPNTRDD